MSSSNDSIWMQRAIDLALRGQGFVEPNPMVGCVLAKADQIVGEGWHQKFGGPHAEINAIESANQSLVGATAYLTLEPCSHHGQTPPCVGALIQAGITRVIVAHPDPNPLVNGAGIQQLKAANIDVEVGLLQTAAAKILAPFLKRFSAGQPWMIAKWAMTLDGKIATASGDSQWISNEKSRAIVHQIRGRVDAIMVGVNTALADNPLLTARPAGPRLATRIVLDSTARLAVNSRLCQSAREFPTLIAVGPQADFSNLVALEKTGCEIWRHPAKDSNQRLMALLGELSRRGLTNVLVEGGGGLLGSLQDLDQIDETHVFIGAKILGGRHATSVMAGVGKPTLSAARKIQVESVQQLDNDVYIVGRTTEQ